MKSFTLWACKDMTSTLKKYQRDMRTLFGANTRLMAYCADIKNMYTELPHDVILDAIRFALQHCRDTNRRARRRALTFELRTRGTISFGKPCTSDSTTHA